MDKNGILYLVEGLGGGYDLVKANGNITVGYLMRLTKPDEDVLKKFLTGEFDCITVGYRGGIQIVASGDSISIEVGVMTPQASVMHGYSTFIGKYNFDTLKEIFSEFMDWDSYNRMLYKP